MHAGTTSDIFLRENLEWLGYASNWSKFTATAALGVIHKGHFEQGMLILGPYLPSQNGGESNLAGAAYSEGGSLYALGLINAGVGSGHTVENYLRDILKAAQGEVVQHGAALGLGVAGMGGHNAEAYDDLKQTLFTDSAVAGEAAGYAMGLIMLGTADATCADEMLTYARETQHEKIIRGLSVGLAFLFYGRQEEADSIIKELLAEKVGLSAITHGRRVELGFRIQSYAMVVFIPSHWPMQVHPTMTPFASSCTLQCRTRPMMSVGRL